MPIIIHIWCGRVLNSSLATRCTNAQNTIGALVLTTPPAELEFPPKPCFFLGIPCDPRCYQTESSCALDPQYPGVRLAVRVCSDFPFGFPFALPLKSSKNVYQLKTLAHPYACLVFEGAFLGWLLKENQKDTTHFACETICARPAPPSRASSSAAAAWRGGSGTRPGEFRFARLA